MIRKTLLLGLLFGSSIVQGQSPPQIHVFLDAKEIVFADQKPIERKGTIYVPVVGIFQKMGATISFDEAAKIVRVVYGEKEIEIPIGVDHSTQNGSVVVNGGNAIIVNGRAMVPLRFISEQLDAKVLWDGATRSVRISTVKVLDPATGTTGGTGGNGGN